MHYQRDLTPKTDLAWTCATRLPATTFPTNSVQEAAGQRQAADNFETMGIIAYQHTFSPQAVADFRGMVRDNSNDFYSNANSTPVQVLPSTTGFAKATCESTVTIAHGHNEWKFGCESDNTFLNENDLSLRAITDLTTHSCDPAASTPPRRWTLHISIHRESARLGTVSVRSRPLFTWEIGRQCGPALGPLPASANRQAFESALRDLTLFPFGRIVLHFSYDRVFQTPSFENILYSSSPQVTALSSDFLRLPVEPSEGNYYEVGLTNAFAGHLRFDANYFRRLVSNYADDDQIDNTTISFPIAFRKAIIYGAEAKVDLAHWGRFSGYLSYSYTVGNVWNPVTGGLFLGDNADAAESELSGHFPDSQDQRNTVRGRLRFQVAPRVWIAGGIQYDTGLPFEFQCDPSLTLQQCIGGEAATYGQDVVNRINFVRGRILPSFQVNASAGVDLYTGDRFKVHFQADGENLNNVLDVIDFGGLFSGNAIGPPRSFALRLRTDF